MIFENRYQAGRQLAEKLKKYHDSGALVLAIPRGGVVVAEAIVESLDARLDLMIPRKVGLPGNPELAAAAVGPDGTVIYNQQVLRAYNLQPSALQASIKRELAEIKRRLVVYGRKSDQYKISAQTVIVVDDGIATGLTITAALSSLKKKRPQKLILAVPVAPLDTLITLRPLVDELICLLQPEDFYAVGQFYRDFSQVTDDQVLAVLSRLQR